MSKRLSTVRVHSKKNMLASQFRYQIRILRILFTRKPSKIIRCSIKRHFFIHIFGQSGNNNLLILAVKKMSRLSNNNKKTERGKTIHNSRCLGQSNMIREQDRKKANPSNGQ